MTLKNSKKKQNVPNKLSSNTLHLELFTDITKKFNEWNYWRKEIIINFTKIVLGKENYVSTEKNDNENLQKLLYYIELLFYKGINN